MFSGSLSATTNSFGSTSVRRLTLRRLSERLHGEDETNQLGPNRTKHRTLQQRVVSARSFMFMIMLFIIIFIVSPRPLEAQRRQKYVKNALQNMRSIFIPHTEEEQNRVLVLCRGKTGRGVQYTGHADYRLAGGGTMGGQEPRRIVALKSFRRQPEEFFSARTAEWKGNSLKAEILLLRLAGPPSITPHPPDPRTTTQAFHSHDHLVRQTGPVLMTRKRNKHKLLFLIRS